MILYVCCYIYICFAVLEDLDEEAMHPWQKKETLEDLDEQAMHPWQTKETASWMLFHVYMYACIFMYIYIYTYI